MCEIKTSDLKLTVVLVQAALIALKMAKIETIGHWSWFRVLAPTLLSAFVLLVLTALYLYSAPGNKLANRAASIKKQ